MNKDVLNNDSIEEFKKLVQNTDNFNKDSDCYVQLIKELMIRAYCNN